MSGTFCSKKYTEKNQREQIYTAKHKVRRSTVTEIRKWGFLLYTGENIQFVQLLLTLNLSAGTERNTLIEYSKQNKPIESYASETCVSILRVHISVVLTWQRHWFAYASSMVFFLSYKQFCMDFWTWYKI